MTRQKKPTLAEAMERADKNEREGFVARMIAAYLLAGREPDLDRVVHGARVRAWGLHRSDGGYIAIQEVADLAVPVLRSALAWEDEWRSYDPYVHRHNEEIFLRSVAMRDEIAPEIRRLWTSLGDRRGF